jgi:serine/threonine protein kinase
LENRWYKSPEQLFGSRSYGTEIDMWALGCVFGYILNGSPLFTGVNDIDQISRIARLLGEPTPENWNVFEIWDKLLGFG